MSISGSLSNAFSGLTAAARGVEVVSQNLSNAMTEGYGRREVVLSSNSLGGVGAGVRVDGVVRVVNQHVISDRRLAEASLVRDKTIGRALAEIETAIGLPGEPGSLATRLTEFESALSLAASRPDSETRLEAAVRAATGVISSFNQIANTIQTERTKADSAIAEQVGRLNSALERIAELNQDIRTQTSANRDPGGLVDERQRLIDQVSAIVPVRELPRENGQVALVSTGGAILLDGPPGKLDFTPAALITADTTPASGALSGLTLRGQPVEALARTGVLGGGSLGALFSIRDEIATSAQMRLDAVARELVERFEDPGVDPSRAPGDPGLFSDNGAVLDASNEVGLSSRLSVNVLVDPSQGGAVWRLRDGLGAATPGPVGQAAGLNALVGALREPRVAASGGFGSGLRSAASLGAELISGIGSSRQAVEGEIAYSRARHEALRSAELADGVDTDQELQRLLLIEQAYSANARVVAVAEAMLDRLMEI